MTTRLKNTGKEAEKLLADHLLKTRGKAFYLHRVDDASDIRGRTGTTGFAKKQPSDLITVIDGVTAFTEVKSTHDDTAFRFSLFKDHQLGSAERITKAGGNYVVFVFRMKTREWFRVPFVAVMGSSKKSMTWQELEEFKWT